MTSFYSFEKVKQVTKYLLQFLFWIGKQNITQVSLPRLSIFLILDVPTLKLRIIIILPTDRHEIILPTACTTKK